MTGMYFRSSLVPASFFWIWTFMFMAMWVMSRIRIFFSSRSLPQEHMAKKKKKKRRLGKKSFPGRRRPKRLGFFPRRGLTVFSPHGKFDTRFLFPRFEFWVMTFDPFFSAVACSFPVYFRTFPLLNYSCNFSPALLYGKRSMDAKQIEGMRGVHFWQTHGLMDWGKKRGGEPKTTEKTEMRHIFLHRRKKPRYLLRTPQKSQQEQEVIPRPRCIFHT